MHLFLRDANAFLVRPLVELGFDAETGLCARVANEFDNAFKGAQGPSTPILSDVAEKTMLDLVPLAGAWWKVTDSNSNICVIGKLLKFMLPHAGTVSIASARVGGDEEHVRIGIGAFAH